MGKRTQRKSSVSPPDSNNPSSRPITAFLTREKAPHKTAPDGGVGPKMATGTTEAEMGEEGDGAVTLMDLKAVETSIIEKLSNLLGPVQEQLTSIKAALAETHKTAENAIELAMTVSEGSRQLQSEQEALKQKVLAMDMEARALNVKIRGLPENVETPLDLQAFITNWIATTMKLEDGVAPTLTRVRRLGAPVNPKRQRPRDVLVSFLGMRDKIAFLREARKLHPLKYNDGTLEIFQDIPPDALNLRRELKLITHQLNLAGIRYRWVGPAKLQVQHKGMPLFASTLESGFILLHSLGLPLPAEITRKTPKRKLDLLLTPPKDSKIAVSEFT